VKKKEYKRAKKRFTEIALPWASRMGLKWWDLHFHFHKKTPEHFKRSDGGEAGVRVVPRWEYLHAYFEVNTPGIAELSDTELEVVIVHELCHVLVNEMREEGIKHEERVCSRLSQAFLWTKEGH